MTEKKEMKPLWRLRSGRFAGWRTEDEQLYDTDGAHLGYFVNEIAYRNDGRAIGEIYGERYLGKRETVVYPTGTRQAARRAMDVAGMRDRDGMALAGWSDTDF